MIHPETVKKLKALPEWQELETYLKDTMRLLDSVSDIGENEDHEKVARGKKYAIKTMHHILAPFDIPEITDEENRKEAYEKLGLAYYPE